MADTVTVTMLSNTIKECTYEFTNESDGTGESLVKKIDLLDLVCNGLSPTSITLIDCSWTVSGFNYVTTKWDRSPDYLIEVMSGTDGVNYESVGGKRDPGRGQIGSGNVLLTTDGAIDGASYRITMKFKKKYN